jgi:hypothetical protein
MSLHLPVSVATGVDLGLVRPRDRRSWGILVPRFPDTAEGERS